MILGDTLQASVTAATCCETGHYEENDTCDTSRTSVTAATCCEPGRYEENDTCDTFFLPSSNEIPIVKHLTSET